MEPEDSSDVPGLSLLLVLSPLFSSSSGFSGSAGSSGSIGSVGSVGFIGSTGSTGSIGSSETIFSPHILIPDKWLNPCVSLDVLAILIITFSLLDALSESSRLLQTEASLELLPSYLDESLISLHLSPSVL